MNSPFRVVVCLLAFLGGAAAVAQEDPAVSVRQLTDKLYLLSTDQGRYTTNSIAFVGTDGVLLVDTQSEEDAAAFKKVVDAFGKGSPRYIINTHRHVEHVGGNAIFGEAPVVIAHDLVRTKLSSGSYIFDEFPDATFPDITLSDSLTLHFNGERIEIRAMAGSHDDNEIIVQFVDSGVVHLSSLTNGFNFPSIDSDGDVLMFEKLVAQAIELLPEDVVIVSGHNDVGTMEDLRAYHEMLVATETIVRTQLAAGKDLAAMQAESVLGQWESYAGSYVSANEWIESLVDGLEDKDEPGETVFVPLYHVWKAKGAAAAVEHYFALKRDHPGQYRFGELTLLVIGDKLLKKGHFPDAAAFFEASLRENPDFRYAYYAHYELARAHRQMGGAELARPHCKLALELNPEFRAAAKLLEELEQE